MNSKFVYIERNIQTNLNNLYQSIQLQRCQLEKNTLELQLALASLNPLEFAYIFSKGPGYTAVIMGEVIYIIKCKPVYVILRHTQVCFQELPIIYKNESYFLTPKTRLTQKHGEWYGLNPNPTTSVPPQTLSPTLQLEWSYKSIKNLALSGIHTDRSR